MTVDRILAETDVLLLDFDGPICTVFAGLPAPVVADRLRSKLDEPLPNTVETTKDPFDVLIYASTIGVNIEKVLRDQEVEAVHGAKPTAGSHDLITAWKATGRPLAVVSNNSKAAVATYLQLHNLTNAVDAISARETAEVTLLKPNPHLVTNAVTTFEARPARCTLIGDSLTDIEPAHGAGVRAIGYANAPGKTEAFRSLAPAAIVTTMPNLSDAARRNRS